MMKKNLFILILIALISVFSISCSNDDNVINEYGEKTVSLVFDGDFNLEPFTRALSNESAKDIWIFDYMDNKLVQTVHQNVTDINFGNPQIVLKYGQHKMYFVMSSGDKPSHLEYMNVITWQTVGDTFWQNATVEINKNSTASLRVILNRAVSMMKIKAIDNIPDNAKYIKVIPSTWHYSINYITGQAGSTSNNREILYELNNSDNEFYFYGFSNGEETTNLEITSLTSSQTIIKHVTYSDIPFMNNKITNISTRLYSDGDVGDFNYSFNVNHTWNSGYNIN